MKHKLKLSFWALGILVLIMSQLFALAPAPKVSAATLTLDSIKEDTYKFSIYAAWHSCLTYFDTGTAVDEDLIMDKSSPWTQETHFLGFAGSDGNDNDGLVTCAEAGKLWMTVAGYSDVGTMLTDLGFQKNSSQNCTTGGPSSQVCYDAWSIGSKSRTDILNKHTSLASSKGIPTSVPTWGRYILAISAMQAKCIPGTTTGPAAHTDSSKSVKYVADNSGKLTSGDFTYGTANTIAAWPGASGGNSSSCSYLIGVVEDSSTGALALSSAMANSRIATTLGAAENAICDQLGMETTREKDDCMAYFSKILNKCVDAYYKANSSSGGSSGSRVEPFDAESVASCVVSSTNKKLYDISNIDIASILGDAQNQATPDTSSSTSTTTDPCAILGNDIPMRWLACALLTAGSGMAATFYAMAQNLLYMPVSSVFNDTFDRTAQNFRIIGMALIVIAGLVMIIAQATGSDLVDAYTVKKVLPKLGFAIVGMAVALPLLKFAITLTNDIGIAAGDIIIRLGGAQAVGDSATIGDNIGAVFLGLGGVAVAGVIWGWAAITFIGTAALGLLIGVIVLAIRQMAIVVLVMLAPLAIAASVLPGTDKLWKFWRTTLISTLMMFPIIMMFLKAGEFMATVFSSMAGDQDNGLYTVLAALIFFAPYFMIPLAFKMAGGLISTVFGMMNDRGKGLFDRMTKFRSGYGQVHRERTIGRQMLSGRAEMQRSLKAAASRSRNPFGRAFLGGVGRAVGGYNLEAQMSQRQAAVAKELNDQIATGADDEIRGLSVNKRAALTGRDSVLDPTTRDADGTVTSRNGSWRQKSDGTREFKTLGGAWMSEAAVDEGHRRWGRDHFAQQAALSYEMRKANSEEDVERISSGYHTLAKDAWGMTDTEAGNAWIGASFENQNQHIEFKKTAWKTGDVNYDGLVDELYEKKGSYPLAQMHSRTIERLKQGYQESKSIVEANGADPNTAEYRNARERMMKIEAITETFMSEYGGGSGGYQMDPSTGQPIAFNAQRIAGNTGGSNQSQPDTSPYRVANTPGAAHVAERVQELAELTGAFQASPTAVYDQDLHHAAPTTTTRSDGVTITLGPNDQKQNRP